MKKYIALILATVALVSVIGQIPEWVESSLTKATVVTVKKGSHTETVIANGTVAYRDQVEIKTELPFIPSGIHVEVGDTVSVGDLLVSIDKNETVSAAMSLLSLGKNSAYSEVLEAFSGQTESLTEWAELLPEHILSTASGTVTDVRIAKGELAMPNTVIITVSDSKQLQATVAVSEASAAKLKVGQKVSVTGTALKGKKYSGTVIKIAPTARKQFSGTTQQTVVDTLIGFHQVDDALKAGYSVKAEITVSDERQFPCLPYSAVGQDENGEYIFVYQAGICRKKHIETGAELSDMIEITSGVEATDRVLNYAERLSDGQFVRIVEVE